MKFFATASVQQKLIFAGVTLSVICSAVVYAQSTPIEYEIDTLVVFPDEITSSTWKNVETLNEQNLVQSALYQQFSKENSAHLPVYLDVAKGNEVVDPQAEEKPNLQEAAPPENAPQPEPQETENTGEAVPHQEVTASTTVLKRMTNIFRNVFTTVVESLPFAQSGTSTVPQTEEVHEEEMLEVDKPLMEEIIVEEEAVEGETATTTVIDNASTTDNQDIERIELPEAEPVINQEVSDQSLKQAHSITLDGFELPLSEETEITGGQLRMSFAAKEKEQFDNETHTLGINYSFDGGSSWQNGGSIDIDDETSNSINGGYFLFALPEITDIRQLESLVIEIHYVGDSTILDGIYLDSVWLELFIARPAEETATTTAFMLPESGYDNTVPSGDRLVLPDGSEIEFTFTDDNTDESLIIKSDRREYIGLSEAVAYFNVTNTGSDTDTFALQTHFESGSGKMTALEEWEPNKAYEVTVPEYRPYVYHCAAGWEEVERQQVTDFSDFGSMISTSSEDETSPVDATEASIENGLITVPETTPSVPATSTPTTSTPTTTPITSEEVETEDAAEPVATSSTSDFDILPATSTDELISASDFEEIPELIDGAIETPEEDTEQQYACGVTSVIRTCDAIEGDGTSCRVNSQLVDTHEIEQFKPGWNKEGVERGKAPDNRGLFSKVIDFLGFGAEQKEIPEKFDEAFHAPNTYSIRPGETKYFKMTFSFDPFSTGEFWIEAVGGDGYGLLDPWWDGEWEYRLPITIDNTAGGLLEDYQIYVELDSSESDFWSNVQSDGDDIRFLRESGGFPDWYNATWGYRKTITIDSTEVDADLTDFPIMISLTDPDLAARAQGDGDDILFTAGDEETKLDHEIEYYASSTGELRAWVKIPSLSSSVDTDIYMYYGNANASNQENATSTWSNGFVGVWHLNEETGGSSAFIDSTVNANHGTDAGSPTLGGAGQIGNGVSFDGTDDRIDITGFSASLLPATFSAWVEVASADLEACDGLIMTRGNGGDTTGVNVGHCGTGTNLGYHWNDTAGSWGWTTGPAIPTDEWFLATLVVGAGNAVGYTQAVGNFNSATNTLAHATTDIEALEFGRDSFSATGGRHFQGSLDEVRIANVARSAGWVLTEFNNQSDPQGFISTSSEEAYIAPTQIELDHWTQYFDSSTSTTGIWVQVDELAAGASTTIYLYYGNDEAESTSDQYEPFTYDELQDLYYVVTGNGPGNDIEVVSLIDNNVVQMDSGATTSLDRGESVTYSTFNDDSVLRALGPVAAKILTQDLMVPISFASTVLPAPSIRNNETFHLYAPYATANYDIFDGAGIDSSGTVTVDTQVTDTAPNLATGGIVETDEPILAYADRGAGDIYALYPATTRDLYGIRSNSSFLGTTQNNTDFDIACSGGSTLSVTGQSRGVQYTNATCTSGADGQGDAVRFHNINQPAGGIQQGDGDGADSTIYLPAMEFGAEYFLPTDTSYAAIACAPEGGSVAIAVFDTGDSQVASGNCTPSGNLPGKLWFDGGNGGDITAFNQGYRIASTDLSPKPFYVYYEDSSTANENNLWGAPQARKLAQVHPSYVIGEQEFTTVPLFTQEDYRFYVNINASTPTDPWPSGGTDVDENSPLTGASAPKDADVLRLRMSISATSNPAVAGSATFKLQFASSTNETCSASLNWSDVGALSSGALWRGFANAAPDDGDTLGSTLLTDSNVAETYEEENNAAANPNEIGIGEFAEWDWVIENNGADLGSYYCFRMVDASGAELSTYTNYPLVRTNGSPDAPELAVPFDNEKLADQTPAFNFATSDSEADDIEYHIQVDDDVNFGSPVIDETSLAAPLDFNNLDLTSDKAPFTTGHTIEYVSQVTLSDGNTYWWRVRGRDPGGTDEWGDWATAQSFTIDTTVTVSTWFQTTDEQFDTDTLFGTETTGSDSVQIVAASSTGTTTSSGIDFDWGTIGNAWGELSWNDDETNGSISYQVEYRSGESWSLIPDGSLSGNSAGFGTSPVTLTSLDPNTYNEIRIKADFTDGASTPFLNDWTVTWAETVAQPTHDNPFDNEKVGTTTPSFEFLSTDPQGDDLEYEISWSTDQTFSSGTTTRNSAVHAGFENIDSADTNPFNTGDSIRFTIEAGDALTNGTTYWWRVRARDPAGGNAWSLWSQPQSFTIDTTVTVSTWFQTTDEQFDTGTLTRTESSGDSIVVSTALGQIAVYREATAGDAITTTAFDHNWDTTVHEDAIYTLSSGTDILLDAGYYAVIYGARFDSTSGTNRSEVQSYLSLNGTDLPTGWSQGFIRRGSSADEALTSGGAIVRAQSDGEALTLHSVRTDANAGGVARAAGASGISVIRLDNTWDYIRLGKDTTQPGPSGSSWIDVTYDRQDELDTGSFAHTAGSGNVTIADPGHYLVFANTYGAIATNDRTQISQRLTLDGSEIEGSRTSVYLRGDQNGESTFEGSTAIGMIIETTDNDQILNVELLRDEGSTGHTINEDDTGAYVDRTGLTIVKLPEADFIRLTDTGTDDMNPAVLAAMGWDTEEEIDTASFTHTTGAGNNEIEVDVNDDYLFLTSLYGEDIGGNIRKYYNQGWRVNGGSLLGYGQTGRYDRESGTANDAGNFSGLVIPSLTSGDFVEVVTQNLGNTGTMAADFKGVQGLRIGSLVEADNRPITFDTPDIIFDEGNGPKWGELSWSDTEPGSSVLTYQVYYQTATGSYALIPDSALPGNSTGFTASPVDLGAVPAATYDILRVHATFTCVSGNCPSIEDITVTWSEGFSVTGTAHAYDRTTPLNSGTVAIAVNGVLQSGKTGSISAGAWEIENVTAFADDVVTVWIEGASTTGRAAAVSIYGGTNDIGGFELYERHLSVGSDDNATIRNADIVLYDNSTGDGDLFFDVDGNNDLTVCAVANCGDSNLYIKEGNTYRPDSTSSGNAEAHDVVIDGTLTLDGNTIRSSGSWDNNGTSTANTGTVIMTATTTIETINSTGAALGTFQNLTFGETSGAATWQLQSPLDVNGALLISHGTLAPQGTTTINVAGNLTIGVNGLFAKGSGTTTFDGTGTVNWTDSTALKEDMGTVVIGGTTKTVRLQSAVRATDLHINSGVTLDVTNSNFGMTLEGSFNNDGTFNPRLGTVTFTSTSTDVTVDAGSASFYNLTFNGVGGSWSFPANTLSVSNDLTIATGTVTLPSATTTIGGSFSNSGGTFMHNNGVLRFTSAGAETILLSGTAFLNHFYDVTFAGSGSWSITDTSATTSNTIRMQQGTVTFPSGTFTVSGDFITTTGAFSHNGGTVQFVSDGVHDISTNGSDFNNVRFLTASNPSDWYNSSWLYRIPITIESDLVDETLTNFPVFIDLSTLGSAFFADLTADGGDIRMTSDDGTTELPREVAGVNTGTEVGQLYFRADTISSASDTTFYLYYGNSGASDYATTSIFGSQNVWSNGYEAVYHFDDDPGGGAPQYVDATGNSAGTAVNMEGGDLIPGIAGGAADVDGANESIQTNFNQDLLASTWSIWLEADGTQGACDGAMFSRGSDISGLNIAGCQDTGELGYHWNDGAGTWGFAGGPVYPTNEWFMAAMVIEPSEATLYSFTQSGTASGVNSIAHATSTIDNLDFGWDSFGAARSFDGTLDEARLSSIARTQNWLQAEYYSIASSTEFASTSAREVPEGGIHTFTETNATILGDLTIDHGTVEFNTGTLDIGGSVTNAGNIVHNNGTVLFNSTDGGETIDFGDSLLHSLTFNGASGGWTITDHATATNNVTLTSAGSFTLGNGQTLSVGNVFTNSIGGASTTWTGSILSLEAGNYSINAKSNAGDAYETLRVAADTDISMWNSSAATYDIDPTGSLYSQDHNAVDGNLYIFGAYERTSGTENWSYATDFDGTALATSSRQVDVRVANGGSVRINSAVFEIVGTSSASTTIDAQSGAFSLLTEGATVTAEYFEMTGTDADGFNLTSSTTVTAFDHALFTIGAGTAAVTVDAATVDTNPAAQFFGTNFVTGGGNVNVTLVGSPSSFWWFREGSGDRYGEAFDNNDGNPGSIRWDDSAFTINISGTVYADDEESPLGGPTCDGSTENLRVVVNGGLYTDTTSCSGIDGSYSFSNVSYNGDPSVIVYLDTGGGERGAAVTRTPTADIIDLDLYANRVVTRHEDTAVMSIAQMAIYDASNDPDIPFSASTGTAHTLSVEPDFELHVWATSTFTPGGTVTLNSGGTGNSYDGSLHIDNAATFTGAGTTTYSIGGIIAQDSGANFIPASTTVLMTATTSGKAITTAAGETLSLNELRFTGAGGGWNLNGNLSLTDDLNLAAGTLTGTGDITLENGSFYGDGLLSLGSGTTTIEQMNTLGGVQPWTFANLTLGNGAVIGTTTPAGTATTSVDGVFTIATGHFLDAGASNWDLGGTGTVFVEDGTFLPDTSTIRYSGVGGANILSTTYYNLDLNASAGTPTFTATGIGIIVLNDLTIGGEAPTNSTFDTGDPALDVDGNVRIRSNGTLVGSNSAQFTVGGSWDNDGTFTGSGGTVTFDGAGTVTIAAGASSFSSLTINGAGDFTISEDATSTAAFILTLADDFTLGSGNTLAVGGTFTNGIGGADTIWTGSTLYLYGGNYTINASTTSDLYETLVVAANTDIRMWNSDATTITVDSAGSLYSQDHSQVDGDLYIFGSYPKTSGTDYWNYARDFDGTYLTGSERKVDVYFASGASATYTGGGLQIFGDESASTTLQNQGAGTYNLRIGGTASTSMRYYEIRDTDASGLTFSGTPNVVDISFGDFLVSTPGGSGITVGGTVLDQNPAKNITGNIFATSSAIAASNVTATGTSVSSWRFTNHTGNIAGEAFDNDPDGDPGYIVWDNSAQNITISGNVYSDEGTSVSTVCDGSTQNIHLRVAGLTSYTTSCNGDGGGGGTGLYSISGVTYSPGDSFVVYIDGESEVAATVSEDPISNINNMHLYEDRVIVRHESTDPLSIADMALWDSSDDPSIPFTAVDGVTDTLTLPANTKLIVWNSKEFEPNGNVTLSGGGSGGAHDGTLELYDSGAFDATGSEAHSIGGSFILGNDATFDDETSTITFTTTGAARIIDVNEHSFHNLTFNGSGSWTITDSALSVANDFTITQGSVTLPTGTTTVNGSFANNGGSFSANGGQMVFGSSLAETIRQNGSSFGTTTFDGSGSWSYLDTNATTTGDFTIEEGTVLAPSGVLAVSGDFVNADTFTHNSGELRLTSAASDAVITANASDLSAVTIAGSGTFTFTDSDVALAGTLAILNGSINLATGTQSIAGSFLNVGGSFAHGSGTILFNSTDIGETIDPGGFDFYAVNIAAPSGGYTIISDATTTSGFSLTSATAFALQSGAVLNVEGVFTNLVGGVATEWSGTTLRINSGSGYTINTKVAGGDRYETLSLGAETDLRTWNSSATTTVLATSSSLYSQDHNNADGELYIYGNYERTTGTDYWSYATDFDGTALGGSSRAVTVRIAEDATTTISESGSLQIIGLSTATTSVTNQGSGTYALSVEGGTLNASQYAMRNLNADGLSLGGATTSITSLSNGDFELAVNGGTLISLASETLDANASKVISGIRFATTTAITGANVTLVGSTSNSWTFTNHRGNLSGEAYDVDGATDCGSLRWSDSSCLLTEQTHYRWRNDNGGEGVPDSEWYNAGWNKRQPIRIDNNDSSPYTDIAVKLSLTYDADMQSDFSDLRFTDETGVTEIPYWIETFSASTDAIVWVQVPSLPSDETATVFMYYESAATTTTSSSTAVFIAADDFEDGNISEYSGVTGFFNVGTTFNFGGTYGLDASGNETERASDGIARFDQTVSQGEIIRYMQYVDTDDGSGDEVCTMFGVQAPVTANNNYAICIEQFGTDRISIVRDVVDIEQSGTVLASSNVTYTEGWYEVEIDWQTDDSIDVSLYNEAGTLIATTSATDSTYTSGGMGFTFWFQHGGWDSYVSRPRVDTAPSIRFGAEQTDGGASWAAAQDTFATFEPSETARLRVAIENSGLPITGQLFELEYAEKGAAPSCEAVSAGSYTSVPNQAGCGTSPICMQSSTQFADNDPTTDLLFETAGAFSAGRMVESPSNQTGSLDIDQDEFTELEYAVTLTENVSDNSYCFRVTDDGSDLDSYLRVAELQLRFEPNITALSLNGGADITIFQGGTTTVYATGTVSDLNGYTDLDIATSTIFRNGPSGVGEACSEDNNNCYRSVAPQCSFVNCSGNSCEISCYADIWYFAEPTDAGTFAGDSWTAFVEVSDSGGATTSASSPSIDLLTTRALTVNSTIDYGTLNVNSDTGSYNATSTVQNIGNDAIDIEIEGTDLSDGGSSIIPVNEQKFATSTFTYTGCVICNQLSSTSPIAVEVDLSKPTTTTPGVIDEVFWGIAVPFGVTGSTHQGQNIFYAIGD